MYVYGLEVLHDIPGLPSEDELRAEVLRVAGPDTTPRRPASRSPHGREAIDMKALVNDITRLRDERDAALTKTADSETRIRALRDELATARARVAAVEVAAGKVEQQNELFRRLWKLVREFTKEGPIRDEFDTIARESGLIVE